MHRAWVAHCQQAHSAAGGEQERQRAHQAAGQSGKESGKEGAPKVWKVTTQPWNARSVHLSWREGSARPGLLDCGTVEWSHFDTEARNASMIRLVCSGRACPAQSAFYSTVPRAPSFNTWRAILAGPRSPTRSPAPSRFDRRSECGAIGKRRSHTRLLLHAGTDGAANSHR